MTKSTEPRKVRYGPLALPLLAIGVVSVMLVTAVVPTTTSLAQDADPALAAAAAIDAMDEATIQERGLALWKRGGCFECHGNFGEGGEGGHFPAGPSLRRRSLTFDVVYPTVRCGRPGTLMPAVLAGAYQEVSCYNLPVPTDPTTINVTAGAGFTEAEITTVVAFVLKELVGAGPVTREECARFHDGNANDPDCSWR